MGKSTARKFWGYEITFQRDRNGVVATAIHQNDTVIIGRHRESVADALYDMQAAIKSIDRHPYPVRRECPPALLKLYNKALVFLDEHSAVHDHYWASGIVRAINRSFPEFPNAVPRLKEATPGVRERAAGEGQRVVLVGCPPIPAIVCKDGRMMAKLQHIWHSGRRYGKRHGYLYVPSYGIEGIGPL
jgi:hypothetical protein